MIIHIKLEQIVANPWQTRRGKQDEQYIRNLADDIRLNGLLQNPVGRLIFAPGAPASEVDVDAAVLLGEIEPAYLVELAFGHNRLAAYKLLANDEFMQTANKDNRWSTIPVELRALTDEQMAMMAWSENEKRRDVSPVERALAIWRRMNSFRWTQERAAEVLGISRPAVGNALRLLNLPPELQDDLHRGAISERQAMALLKLYEVDTQQARLVNFDETRSLLVGMALQGESSEKLRAKVDEAIAWFNAQVQFKLSGLDAPEVEQARETPEPAATPAIVQPPAARPAPEPEPEVEEKQEPEPEPEPLPASWRAQVPPAPREEPEPEPETEAEPEAAPAPAAKAEQKTGELTWAQSTITLTITLWPEDNNSEGRLVVLGARLNEQPPAMQMLRMSAITLPEQLVGMLEALKAEANKK